LDELAKYATLVEKMPKWWLALPPHQAQVMLILVKLVHGAILNGINQKSHGKEVSIIDEKHGSGSLDALNDTRLVSYWVFN